MSNKETKVLVVEDEAGMALLLNKLLENLGYSVAATVTSGEAAIEFISSDKPDIILMDIYLDGEMNGIQAAEIILTKEHIPVIYATSDADEETLQNAKSTYPLGYIVKPYNKNVLKSTIEVALSIKDVEARKNEELKKAYKTITYQTGELLESFKSAKEIQKAILPSEREFQSFFDKTFIINLPKESLGGDFFWFKKLNNKVLLFGVIDCTGHGVPGALMSILVNYQLSKGLSVLPQNSNLGDLMSYIDKNLSDVYWEDENLGLSDEDMDEIKNLNAGFDAGLCSLDLDSLELTFCGAKRPLWIHAQNKLDAYPGNRASVGLYSLANKEFKCQNIQLQKGDKLFLFSDGFSDQMGGPRNKRYRSNRFKSLIESTSNSTLEDQHLSILQEFNSWKSNAEQLDDVLILGLEV